MRLLLIATACMLMCIAGAQQPAAKKTISMPFEKLSGTWIMTKKDGTIVGETWLKKDNNSMTGKSFMIQNGDTTILETVELIKEGKYIFYIPVAYGQNDDKPVRFKLTSINASGYIFENAEHDFPKRIVYSFTSSNTLHAYIDDGTDKKRQHYYYKKQE